MDRRSRHIVVICVAIVTAAIASFGVYRAVDRIPVREVEAASRPVVVAARAMPPGVRVGTNDVRVAAWPASSPVAGSFASVEEVVNRGLLGPVVENEPLTTNKLAPLAAGAGLSPSIPTGMRAMAVKVNEVIGVAGYLDTGTRVDLVVTIRSQTESTSRTVLSNVQVLSAGTRAQQEEAADGNAREATAVVTLLVRPEDAERVALAQAEGQIMLVLRNPLDTEPTTTLGVRSAALFGQDPAPAPVVRAVAQRRPPVVTAIAPVVAPKPYTVEAIRAAKRSEEEVAR